MNTSKNKTNKNVNSQNVNLSAPKAEEKKGLLSEDLLKRIAGTITANGLKENDSLQNGKTIFKKEFNSESAKGKRASARKKMFLYSERILLYVSKGKMELAKEEIELLKSHASKYYLAEDKFENVSDYFTRDKGDKLDILKNTFEIVKALENA